MNTDSATSTNVSPDAPPPAEAAIAKLDALDLKLAPTAKKRSEQIEEEMRVEYLSVLPHANWALIEVEPKKEVSDIIQTDGVASPFAKVIAVGPLFPAEVDPGDRVTYSQSVGLPKELEKTNWSKRYRWISDKQYMARLPRFAGEKVVRVIGARRAAASDESELEAEVQAALKLARNEWDALCAKWGVNPDDPNLRFGPGGPTTTSPT